MRFLPALLILTLTACDEEADVLSADLLPADQAPPPVMAVVGTCPGPVTVNLSGLTPFGTWGIAASPNLAPGVTIPGGPCMGTALRIGPPTSLVASGPASAGGTATLTPTLPPAVCGWYLQMVDLATCQQAMYVQI